MAKNIVLFIDGTWNEPGADETNVRKLFEETVDSAAQKALYLPGIGTDHPDSESIPAKVKAALAKVKSGATGFGTTQRIKKAYEFLSSNYKAGDRIFLFGFSRGAFAVRSLAGFANNVGLLLQNAVKNEYIDAAYYLYETGHDKGLSLVKAFLRDVTGSETPGPEGEILPIHFIGVWDTVAAQGIPGRMGVLSAPFTEYHQTELPWNVSHARHALALHDLRSDFEPLLWTIRSHEKQSLVQMWFAGAHADVGGGYKNTVWSEVALGWMADEAVQQSLILKSTGAFSAKCSHPAADIHQETNFVYTLHSTRVRLALSARSNLSEVTRQSCEVNNSVMQRLMSGSPAYKFRKRLVKNLKKVDDMSVQLAFEVRNK